ncbi:Transcriptional regulator, LysR family [gamma proteobacterium HdN1]|nr:Transcriptional regulator, LysR family [gamma proteobacterium HdN1]
MIDYNEMAIFAKVVDAGSYTRAADKLDLPKSTVSRKITQLEERLGVRLLHRTTRAIKPTEIGKTYYRHCAQMLAEAEEAQRSINQMQAEPSGLLRITAPISFGASFLAETIKEYLAMYPQVRVDIMLDNKILDLIDDEIDVAFRVGPMSDSSLVARTLGSIRLILCASPVYVQAHGAPRTISDLAGHNCVAHNNISWHLVGPNGPVDVELDARLFSNDMEMTKRMLLAGYGIGLLPITLAYDEIQQGQLLQVLPEYHFPDRDVYLVYHSRRQLPTKVAAFIDFVAERCKPVAPWEMHKLK